VRLYLRGSFYQRESATVEIDIRLHQVEARPENGALLVQ